MLGWTWQPQKDTFSLLHLRLELTHYLDQHRGSPRASIIVFIVILPVCSSSSLSAPHSLCLTAEINWKCIKEGHPLPYESSLSCTVREGNERQWGVIHRDSDPLGILSRVENSLSAKEGKEGHQPQKCRSRVSDTQHNTAFTAARHLHNAREEREVYFIVAVSVLLLCKCTFKKVNFGLCFATGGALLCPLTQTLAEQEYIRSLPLCAPECMSACVWVHVYGLLFVPLSVCCQLSNWKLLFQISNKRLFPKCSLCRYRVPFEHSKVAAQRQSVIKWRNTKRVCKLL